MDKSSQLDALKKKVAAAKLPLKASATNLVFGRGNPDAKILFIGEAPGANEDKLGLPFVGAAGKRLSKLLESAGLSEDDIYIANILKYRPPENRAPNNEEIIAHTPYLVEQIRIIRPKVIATLGNYATKFVLASFNPAKMKEVGGITTLHGIPIDIEIDGMRFRVVPLFHPAAMLHNPNLRKTIEDDFLKMRHMLG